MERLSTEEPAAASLGRGQRAIVAAIIAELTPAYPALDDETRRVVHADVTRYVAAQIHGMPGHLRLPYRLALLAFNWLALLRSLRPFTALTSEKRAAYLSLWSDGPIAPMRDFVKLIRSSGLLVYYDHPLVMARLNAERAAGLTLASAATSA